MSVAETTAAASTHAVDISGLTIRYRRKRRALKVIDDISLYIKPGEAYGLVGESGCGKTTVAMALMRYLPSNAIVESGKIMFAGKDLLTLSDSELRALRGDRMAMVYQDPGSALNPSMRIGSQIAEVYRYHRHMDKQEAWDASAAMLEKVQISNPRGVLQRYPHELSGGQQQRIMFAMALATDPELLVLDEPTTGLDATVEAEVLDLVEQLRAQFNTSILFISHNLGIVARICERVGVLYAGRVIEEGPALKAFLDPRHPYTLGLLRCVPRLGMNKRTQRLDPIPGSLPALGSQPPGCNYADRCPIARERCREEKPPLIPVSDTRASRCFYFEEVDRIPPSSAAAVEPLPARSDEVLLKIDDLIKTYHSGGSAVAAVAGVSLEVRRGEVFGLVGESGSGKSSLAKVIVGLTAPTGGAVQFEQAPLPAVAVRRRLDLRRKLQMVFQNPDSALNPSYSIRTSLFRALRRLAGIRSRAELEQRADQLATSVKLEGRHLDARPTALSGGQKQRASIARAFAGSPSLVLCDEPVSALDVSVQAAILNLLVDLQKTGVSYVFISHDLAVVRYIADYIGVMYLGWLMEVGPAEAVFDIPHHPYTESLLSAMPMLESEGARTRVKLRGVLPSPSDPPSGCRFHTRCPLYLGDICKQQEPPWRRGPAGNQYRCHIPPDELLAKELQLRETGTDKTA
ncbi:MAG TPA: ABC transporter ATP-binding protein [Chloroflexota bacterium]|nr:ABC transporter ATP-binding protein [Chloroflexota bacterium]